jgi:hypothetical protein
LPKKQKQTKKEILTVKKQSKEKKAKIRDSQMPGPSHIPLEVKVNHFYASTARVISSAMINTNHAIFINI